MTGMDNATRVVVAAACVGGCCTPFLMPCLLARRFI